MIKICPVCEEARICEASIRPFGIRKIACEMCPIFWSGNESIRANNYESSLSFLAQDGRGRYKPKVDYLGYIEVKEDINNDYLLEKMSHEGELFILWGNKKIDLPLDLASIQNQLRRSEEDPSFWEFYP